MVDYNVEYEIDEIHDEEEEQAHLEAAGIDYQLHQRDKELDGVF